jgi:hypothetical protein
MLVTQSQWRATDRTDPMPKRTKSRPVEPSLLGQEGYQTVDEINELPDKFRRYIHDLATRTDKTGDLRTIVQLREDREALQRRVGELEACAPSSRLIGPESRESRMKDQRVAFPA